MKFMGSTPSELPAVIHHANGYRRGEEKMTVNVTGKCMIEIVHKHYKRQ